MDLRCIGSFNPHKQLFEKGTIIIDISIKKVKPSEVK